MAKSVGSWRSSGHRSVPSLGYRELGAQSGGRLAFVSAASSVTFFFIRPGGSLGGARIPAGPCFCFTSSAICCTPAGNGWQARAKEFVPELASSEKKLENMLVMEVFAMTPTGDVALASVASVEPVGLIYCPVVVTGVK